MKRMLCWLKNTVFIYIYPINYALAATNIGTAAEQVATGPLSLFWDFIAKICYVVGITLFISGVVHYKRYRENPVATPLSKPVTLLLLGVTIGLLPLIPPWLAYRTGVNYSPG